MTDATGPVEASLTDESPDTAKKNWEALPIDSRVNTWGDEIYFSIPVDAEPEGGGRVGRSRVLTTRERFMDILLQDPCE